MSITLNNLNLLATTPQNQNIQNPTNTSNLSATPKLFLGQIFSITITQNQGTQTQFKIGEQVYSATTPTPLKETGVFQVQVKSTVPSLQLEILTNRPTTNQQLNSTLVQETLKQLLPNQMPLSQAIQLLSQPNFLQLLPASMQAQLMSLFESLLKPNAKTNAQDIKSSLISSGVFLENSLKKGTPAPNDLKAKLLQIQQNLVTTQMSEATSKLATILGRALNKITIQQIQLLDNPLLYNLESPLHPESEIKQIQADIRKLPPQSRQTFEVILTLEFNLGEMVTKLSLDIDDNLGIYIWADSLLLEKTISENLNQLRESFRETDIPLKTLSIAKSKPIAQSAAKQVALIDIHV